MRTRPRSALVVLAALVLAAPRTAADVLVVDDDGGPGVDHTDLQAALNAAAPGDTVLVRDGTYGGLFQSFFVNAKPLRIVAERGADVTVNGSMTISDLAAGDVVRVSGIDFTQTGLIVVFGANLAVLDCAGPVWVEDCTFTGPPAPLKTDGTPAFVLDSDAVTFARCTFQGGGIGSAGLPASRALVAIRSCTYAFDCAFQGGDGQDGFAPAPLPSAGGAAVAVQDGSFYGQRCSFAGGAGGDGSDTFVGCVDGQAGGAGVSLAGTAPVVRLLDSSSQGGPGGAAPPCPGGMAGPTGPAFAAAVGSVVLLPGTGYSLSADGPVREGEVLTLVAEGPPGDFLWLWLAAAPSPLYVGPIKSPVLLDFLTLSVFALGPLPAGGSLVLPLAINELGPGIAAANLYLQIAGLSVTDGVAAGAGQGVTFLDGAF